MAIAMTPDRLSTLPSASEVLAYWRALGPEKWFVEDAAVDAEIRDKFQALHTAAVEGLLGRWEDDAPGALAHVIVLDQFSRNMFRGSAAAFAADPLARAAAGRAIARGFDLQTDKEERAFFYLPYMHSEALADQERCLELCRAAGDEDTLEYAELHADIIRRFGRFPHRNVVLGRTTTAEEQAFLDGGGFAG
jgi:uncharacterized protein (DUF924 family)